MNEALRRRWRDLLWAWAVDTTQADRAFEDICKHYGESGRFYHTLDHIQSMLETVEGLGSHATNLNAVKLAVWLHDVIYDSRASDNEERSARYTERLCEQLSIPEGGSVASLIPKTKTHEASGDPDAQVLLDADLAILGASEPDYRQYADDTRKEYAWVPDADYRQSRWRVLENFLRRPKIFHFLTEWEDAARGNIAAEMVRMTAA